MYDAARLTRLLDAALTRRTPTPIAEVEAALGALYDEALIGEDPVLCQDGRIVALQPATYRAVIRRCIARLPGTST